MILKRKVITLCMTSHRFIFQKIIFKISWIKNIRGRDLNATHDTLIKVPIIMKIYKALSFILIICILPLTCFASER